MNFISPPAEFTGAFSDFFHTYVLPNLPSPERVEEFDCKLRRYLDERDPVYVVRYVRDQTRGTEYRNVHGCRMRPTDNSPVWWLHAILCSSDGFPAEWEPGSLFDKMPCHFFRVGGAETLNSAGFHAAHIVPAKNGDSNWTTWNREEMARRMLVNIHPCNVFLVAKRAWMMNGGRPDILAWVTNAYLERYGQVMQRFLADVGVEGTVGRIGDPAYSYGCAALKSSPIRREGGIRKPRGRPIAVSAGARVSKRPCIRRNLVGAGVMLAIETTDGQYLLPHDDLVRWVERNTTALETSSWRDTGIYSWPRPTRSMLEFLRPYSI